MPDLLDQADKVNRLIVGIDIGGTKIAVAIVSAAGQVIAKARMATEVEKGPGHAIQGMIGLARQLLSAKGCHRPAAIGVGCGGPLDPEQGVILSPPNLPGWDAIPLRRVLEDEFGVPVYVDNDANAAALGEYRFGAGRGFKDMVYITMSTGIGGGVIANGQLLHGIRGSAGEIGHQTVLPNGPRCNCGNRGCLEALASGTAIARRAREALAIRPASLIFDLAGGELDRVTAEIVVQAVRQGDVLALEVWDETIEYLSLGLANVVSILAPEVVVIGGGVSAAGDLLFAPLRQATGQRVFLVPIDRIRIVPPELGGEVGVVGAAAVALEYLGSDGIIDGPNRVR